MAWLVVFGVGAGAAQGTTDAPEPASPRLELDTVDGPRAYRLTLPRPASFDGERPALVVLLHGNGGSGARVVAASGFERVATNEGFLLVVPDGLGGSWNYVRGIPGYPETPDDTAFLRALVERVHRDHGTDPARTFVIGLSNGGFMAQRLLCDAPDVFVAAVVVSAAGFAGLEGLCDEAPPRSLALIHGTADDNVPWDGLPVDVPGGTVLITWPVPATFAWWAERAGCRPPAERIDRPGDATVRATSIVALRLDDCAPGREIALLALVGGGHGWPRGATFDAAREAWRFLEPLGRE